MLLLIPAFLLLILSALALRPALASGMVWGEAAPDAPSYFLLFGGFVAMSLLLGPGIGAAMVGAVLLHRFGQIAAARLAGCDAARGARSWPVRWGLLPEQPSDDASALLAALLGPVLALGPLVAMAALAQVLAPGLAARAAGALSMSLGAVGLVALLPLWPLPGGQVMRALARSLRPGSERLWLAALSGAMIWLALVAQMPLLLTIAALSALLWALHPVQAALERAPLPLPAGTRLRAFGAWLAAFGAHLVAGFWLFALPVGL